MTTTPNFGLNKKTLVEVRRILAACAQVKEAVLYGSRAKGNYKPGSDIDLTLIGSGLTHHMLAKLAGELDESFIPYQVDLSIKAAIDNPNLLEHIERVGVVFYERDAAGHVTPAGGNVFTDSGLHKAEANALKAQAPEVIAKTLAIKTANSR